MMIIPGAVSVTFKDLPWKDVLDLCVESHLKAIEWSEDKHVWKENITLAEEIGNQTRKSGISIAAYGSYYRLGEPDEKFLKSLSVAKALGAPLIRIWGGTKPSEDVMEPERKEFAVQCRRLCEQAQQQNIKVALEWHKNTITDKNTSAERFLDETSHENLYCLWQPTVEMSMEARCEGIDKLEKRGKLQNLHVYYWPKGVRRPLAEGKMQWRQYFWHVNLHENRYALLEFVKDNSVVQFMEDAETLLAWLDEIQTTCE